MERFGCGTAIGARLVIEGFRDMFDGSNARSYGAGWKVVEACAWA